MNKPTIVRLILGLLVVPVMVLCLAVAPRQAQAQDSGSPADFEKFSREELAQMLGPIALYPDRLLSQILMASTYPIEVIEADRWVKRNPDLQGDALDRALLDKEWDPSVKAIAHFPAILALMSERITETTNLGNAFLVQEAEVMAMIQELRASAYAQGNLVTTEQQQVIVEQETIIIEPTNPRVIYVPYYDPFYVYGPWWYPAYPPYYWGPPGVRVSLGYNLFYWPGIHFSFIWGTWSHFDWHHHYVFIHVHERPRFVKRDHWHKQPRWEHSPVHRRGVAYRDKYTATKFGQFPQRPAEFRDDVRGFPERRELVRGSVRSGDEGRRIDQNRRVDDNARVDRVERVDRSRQEQQRIERELQRREPQLRQPVERDRQRRQEQTEVERAPRDRQRIESPRQERSRIERAPQERQRFEQQQPVRQRVDQERQGREAVEGARSQQRRDNVFTQPDNGRNERQFSERGRSSRQERSDGFRDRGRGDDRRGGSGGGEGSNGR
jgi:hypothetical protein